MNRKTFTSVTMLLLSIMMIWGHVIALTFAQDEPEIAQDLYTQGRNLALEGDFEAAIEAYSEALALDPNLVEALYWRGIAYNILDEGDGNTDEAIADWQKAIELYTDIIDSTDEDDLSIAVADAYLGRGRTSNALEKSAQQDLLAALEMYTEIIETTPEENAHAYYQRGLVHRLLGNDEDLAIADYERSQKLDTGMMEDIRLDHYYVIMYGLRSSGGMLDIYNQVVNDDCGGTALGCDMATMNKIHRLWGGQPLVDACTYFDIMGDEVALPTMVDHLNNLIESSGKRCP